MEDFPSSGKIQNNFFKSRIFPYCGHERAEVTVGPQYGVDVSVVQLPNGLAMAMTSDPLSLIPTVGLRESAWLSVQLMANDMATTGFAPQYAQFVLNLPVALSADDFEQYWKYIHEYCAALGVAITGGHTGRFEGLNTTVSGGGTMITVAPSEDLITSKGARPGDVVLLTKECALISTSILALSFPETVTEVCGKEIHQQGCELFYQTSAVEAGLTAGEIGRPTRSVSAMHDVTEGGVMGALCELSHACGYHIEVDEEKIPVGTAQQKIGDCFEIDPRYCVGAGAMIITAKANQADVIIKKLQEKGIRTTSIGTVTDGSPSLTIKSKTGQKELHYPQADPYWGAFFTALNKGWK